MSKLTTFFDLDNEGRGKRIAVLGIPFEYSTTFGTGTKFAPDFSRIASFTLYPFSPWAEKGIRSTEVADLGNIRTFSGNPEETEKSVVFDVESLKEVKKFVFVGGEHSITPMVLKAIGKRVKSVLVFDAHLDFDPAYDMERHSHASALFRAYELLNPEEFAIVGARSFTREELSRAHSRGIDVITSKEISDITEIFSSYSGVDYVSIDVDFFKPSVETITGTPEPGGIDTRAFLEAFFELSPKVGVDIVEAAPPTPIHPTAVFVATLVREAIVSLE